MLDFSDLFDSKVEHKSSYNSPEDFFNDFYDHWWSEDETDETNKTKLLHMFRKEFPQLPFDKTHNKYLEKKDSEPENGWQGEKKNWFKPESEAEKEKNNNRLNNYRELRKIDEENKGWESNNRLNSLTNYMKENNITDPSKVTPEQFGQYHANAVNKQNEKVANAYKQYNTDKRDAPAKHVFMEQQYKPAYDYAVNQWNERQKDQTLKDMDVRR